MQTQSTTSKNDTLAGHSTYVHTRVISEQRNRSPKARYTRSERANFKRDTQQTLVHLAIEAGQYELAGKQARCYGNVTAITCGKHVAQLIPDYTCGSRLCPYCAMRRASKLVRKYLPAVVAFPVVSNTQACLLTLTQKHRPETFKASVKRITASFKALRRSAIFKTYFKGGLFSIEFTIDAEGLYHTHMHQFVFRTRELPKEDLQKLKDRWLEITGDSHVLNLKYIDPNQDGGIMKGLRETLKYAVKPSCIDDLTPAHLTDFLAMKNQRLFGTFGEFQKFARDYAPEADVVASLFPPVETHAGAPCSSCGHPLFDVRLKGSELPAFLARCDASPLIE